MASQVTLKGITRELMHLYYQGFQRDPDIFMDMGCFSEFCYDPKAVDLRFDRYIQAEDRRSFFIMDGASPVGEICLKEIDPVKKHAVMSIHLQNDSVKNRGIGTAAEKLILAYAFDQMNLEVVLADAVLKNTRSQHVLEKVGFDFVMTEGIFKFYRFTLEKYRRMKADQDPAW